MENAGIDSLKASSLVSPEKAKWPVSLSNVWQTASSSIRCLAGNILYRGDICNELNIERYVKRRGHRVLDPVGTHDDVFWSLALAVYATANMEAEPFFAAISRG